MTTCRRLVAVPWVLRYARSASMLDSKESAERIHTARGFALLRPNFIQPEDWARQLCAEKPDFARCTDETTPGQPHGGGGGSGRQDQGRADSTNYEIMKSLMYSVGSAGLLLALSEGSENAHCFADSAESAEQQKISTWSASKEVKMQSDWMKTIESYGGMLVPAVNKAFAVIDVVAPFVVTAIEASRTVYRSLPITMIEALGGLAICFFGGLYPLTIAAAEAFRASGGTEAMQCLKDLWEELVHVYEANKDDNLRDDDHDGVADVQKLGGTELVGRKLALVLKEVNPSKLLDAYGGLVRAFAGVCATLKLQFAKVLSLAASIANAIRPVMVQVLGPLLVAVMPTDYHKWVYPLIDVCCKLVAGSVAWFLYRLVAAVHAGIVGGLICTRALLRWANEKELVRCKDQETMLDEYAGWLLAAVGIYFQVSNWMTAPFPLRLVLFPINACENALQWAVTWVD